jgi:glycosyltransferase involved in cell wall biosynthesis
VILCIGSITAYKRQNDLLKVAERLHELGCDFELQFVGSASRESAYGREFLERVQNRTYTSYLGLRTDDDLLQLCDCASALVHVSAVETFGLVVAEALSRNLRFFGFRVGGVADIAEGVEGAELFNDGDWNGLQEAVHKWMLAGFPRSPSTAEIMRARYHPETVARRHLQIYREVLSTCS